MKTVLWLVIYGLVSATAARAQVVLNEILADNRAAVPNGQDFPDYIELANRSSTSVTLTGMSLTDDPANPRRFVFPAGVTIPPGGHLMVWSDDRTNSPGLHTGFALGAKGENVRLYAVDGATILDEITFGLQLANLSIGRSPDNPDIWVLTTPTPGGANRAQNTGATGELRINEWMARPASGHDWIELFNGDGLPVALGGLVITDATNPQPQNRPIPALSFIPARGFVQFFASDLDQPDADHLDFRLGATGETLTLLGTDRATILDRVTFADQTEDISQGRAPDGSDNIVFFPLGGATPGEPNFAEITDVVISEVLSHTDPPLEDAIELQNLQTTPVDVSHWWLSDSASEPQKYRIPPGTVIPPSGFVVFYEYQFLDGPAGFSLDSAEGDEVFLSAGDTSGRLLGQQTYVEFGGLRNGVSVGRFQTTTGVDFVPLERPTFGVDNPGTLEQFRRGTGQANAAARVGPVVITEIHYNASEDSNLVSQQFVEFHNPTSEPAPLYDVLSPTNTWHLRDGISFDFPLQITLAPGSYLLVVGFDPVQNTAAGTEFRSRFAVPATVPLVGPFEGRLSSSGERIELLRPDEPEGQDDPNAGFVPYELAEGITYAASAPWPVLGAGQSLQRRAALTYGNEPANWMGAPPTAGRGGATSADSDGDGMPDSWELAHGLSPDSPADAVLDADNDGLNNLGEYLAGTDPRNPLSLLRITSVQVQGNQLRFLFPAVQGKPYILQATELVPDGRWLTVTNLNAAPATGELEFLVPPQSTPAAYYRLTIPSQP